MKKTNMKCSEFSSEGLKHRRSDLGKMSQAHFSVKDLSADIVLSEDELSQIIGASGGGGGSIGSIVGRITPGLAQLWPGLQKQL